MESLFLSSLCLETRSTTCLSFKYPLKGLVIQNRTGRSERPYQNLGSYLALRSHLLRADTPASRIHREEGILILAGGLTVHNLHDRKQFSEKSASPDVTMLDQAITVAASKSQVYTAYSYPFKIAHFYS
jgi:hypothetical protein